MIDTGHNVLADDVDVVVAIGSGMFVPEADDVTQLVDDDAELVAILADGYGLRPVAPFAHEGAASNSDMKLIIPSLERPLT